MTFGRLMLMFNKLRGKRPESLSGERCYQLFTHLDSNVLRAHTACSHLRRAYKLNMAIRTTGRDAYVLN